MDRLGADMTVGFLDNTDGDDSKHEEEALEIINASQNRRIRNLELQNAALAADTAALARVMSTLRSKSQKKVSGEPRALGPDVRNPDDSYVDELRVMGIMDEFTAAAFDVACVLFQPSLNGWQEDALTFAPDVLIVESAWQGNNGAWAEKVNRVSSELKRIVEWCNERRIPTVFWNKEDPVHYDSFIANATLFDHVFTTDIECIGRYKRVLEHDRVYLMPFFCEPGLHNPVVTSERSAGFSFAGAYYHRYAERQKNFEDIIDGVRELGPVTIYDRNYGLDLPQFAFPETYREMVVGSLPYADIDTAYKGYDFGINLNSVKKSPSMFARRVFDLLLSDTHVISNYSRGLRLMFGDLITSTDDPEEVHRRTVALMGSSGRARYNPYASYVRLLALRKVIREHTTAQRLAYIASKIWSMAPTRRRATVAVMARVDSRSALDRVMASYLRQSWDNKELLVFLDCQINLEPQDRVSGVSYYSAGLEDEFDRAVSAFPVASLFNSEATYGRHYLEDAIHAFDYVDASVINRDICGIERLGLESAYRVVKSAPLESSVWKTDDVVLPSVSTLRSEFLAARSAGWPVLNLPAFDYAPSGTALFDTGEWARTIHQGIGVERLLEAGEKTLAEGVPVMPATALTGGRLGVQFPPRKLAAKNIVLEPSREGFSISSSMQAQEHEYIYAQSSSRLSDIYSGDAPQVMNVVTTPGLLVSAVVRYINDEGKRIGAQIFASDSNGRLKVPEEAVAIQVGLRVQGSGSCQVLGISYGEVEYPEHDAPVVAAGNHLIVTNIYPSADDLYRNAFVHSRARAYRDAGLRPAVFVLNTRKQAHSYEYEGIDVQVGDHADLAAVLATNKFRSVLVHFLNKQMWGVLKRYVSQVPVIVWIHGSEIQPWHRRKFSLHSEEQLAAAKLESKERLNFWRPILAHPNPNLHFVFVSNYFSQEVMEDTGVQLGKDTYSVIHNFVNGDLFRYREKSHADRLRVLSIRPFASAKYANDISVKAILALRGHPRFDEAVFTVVGDGPLFEETVAPLAGLDNVKTLRTFLKQHEIAEMHSEYGVFLNPTRWDSQGVSRDEAMASGLVPVTNRVAAVPEFVDVDSGILAEADNPADVAAGIAALWDDQDLFMRMSTASAKRVRQQSGYENTISLEIRLIRRLSTDPRPRG